MTGPEHDWRHPVRAHVEVLPDRVIKRYPPGGEAALAREVAAYERLPWAAPALLAVDAHTLEIERCTPILDTPPDPAHAGRLRALLERVHDAGWVHGDVSLINVVLHEERGPLLIDWETSGPAHPGLPSYDLFGGEASHCPPERIPPHQRPHGVWWGGPSLQAPAHHWRTMRIVALVHYYVPHYMAGSETMLHAMLRALAARGHHVEVIVTSHERGPSEYQHEGIRVRCAGRKAVVEMLDEVGADVIVSHHQEAPNASHYAAGCSRRKMKKPRVVDIFHNTFPGAMQVCRRWKPDLAVFNTAWVEEHYRRRRMIMPRTRTLVVHPPIDGARHRTRPGKHVTLVNLNRDKGGEILYELAERMPDVQFLGVVGGHGEQIIRTDVPNVRIQQHTANPRRDIWGKTRVLLMPSVYESYGMVSIEAAHSGIPTIANPTPGLKEALGDAGVWADRRRLDEWEAHIRRLMETAEWRLAAKKARARAAELDPGEELSAWVDAIESL
ncbi:glycosyltransferase [Nocardiopsis eucommiae]|uniref:glycosyltransferase n=1 Tax=Nocardiopsis eucommiae TaxID=2831970 RepID=UPI003D753E3B